MYKKCIYPGWLIILWGCLLHACHPGLLPQKLSPSVPQPLALTYVKASAMFTYQDAHLGCQRGLVRFRVQKDTCIWFSVLSPWGIEVLRGMMTPAGVTVLNHLQKSYYAYDYAALEARWPLTWDYALLQALLLGQVVPTQGPCKVVPLSAQQAMVQQKKAQTVLTCFINPTTHQVQQTVLSHLVQPHRLVSTYQVRDNGPLFDQVQLAWYMAPVPELPAAMLMLQDFKVVGSTKPLSFPFSIPQQYEKQ